MSINLNDLPLEAVGQVDVDFNNYADPQEFAPPVKEGTLQFKTVKAEVDKFDQATGVVTVIFDHEVYDPADGSKVGTLNFDRVSNKVFPRSGVPVSIGADMLRAVGTTQRPASPREWGEQLVAVKSFCDQGNFWTGVVKWDGYCGHKGTSFETVMDDNKKPLAQQPEGHRLPIQLRGAKSWPLEGANGSEHRAQEVPCSVCGTAIQARAKVDRRIPKS